MITQDGVSEPLMHELVNLNKNNPVCSIRLGNAWSAGLGLTYDLQSPEYVAKCYIPARTYIKAEYDHLKLVFTCLDRRHNRKLKYEDYSDFSLLALAVYNLVPKVLDAHLKDYSMKRVSDRIRRQNKKV